MQWWSGLCRAFSIRMPKSGCRRQSDILQFHEVSAQVSTDATEKLRSVLSTEHPPELDIPLYTFFKKWLGILVSPVLTPPFLFVFFYSFVGGSTNNKQLSTVLDDRLQRGSRVCPVII